MRRKEVQQAKAVRAFVFVEDALAALLGSAVARAEDLAVRMWQMAHGGADPDPGDEDWRIARQRSIARTIMPLVGAYSTVEVDGAIAFVRGGSASDGVSSKATKLDPELYACKRAFFAKVLGWAVGCGLPDDRTSSSHVTRFHELLEAHRKFWLAR